MAEPANTDHYSEAYRRVKTKLKGDKSAKFATLKKQVIDRGLCSSCGACVASCPVNALGMVNERPKLIGKCMACGICLHQCPKTKTTVPQLIGNVIEVYRAKTLLPEVTRGQDGGVVTSLLIYLLKEKLVDAEIITKHDENEPWKPKPAVITSKDEILKSSGSIYSQSQSVSKLMEAIKAGHHSIAFVGCPCNIDAVTKMQNSPYGLVRLFMRSTILKIGLFCMDAFSYDRLKQFVEVDNGIPIADITKMTIVKGKFQFFTKDGNILEHAVHSMDHLRASSCYYCVDLTSENADISIGSVGSPDGYNTIIARTGLGVEIVEDAAENGYISLEPLTNKQLTPLLKLANLKKVQLYTVNRRRSFAFGLDSTDLVTERTAPPSPELMKEGIERKLARVEKTILVGKDRYVKISVSNKSGKVLDSVNVRITLLAGEFFESHSWDTAVREWFPGEILDFEVPRVGKDSEYLVHLSDRKGKIMTKKISIEKLFKKE